MNKTEKSKLADQLKEKFQKATVAVFADYKGLSATQADDLRRTLRTQKTEVKVIKNSVARLVMKEAALGKDAKDVVDSVVGPTMVAFSFGDPAATAKIIHKFSQDNEAFKLKDSLMGSKRLDASGIEVLAKLPSREVLLSRLLGQLNAPITSFVGVLAAVPRSLVTVLKAIEQKKAETEGAK